VLPHFRVGFPGADGDEGLPGGEAHIRSRFFPAAAAIAGRRCRLGNITGAVRAYLEAGIFAAPARATIKTVVAARRAERA